MKTLEEFLEDLGRRESSGNYKARNQLGYIGKYQMGEPALVDVGYYKPKPTGVYNNDWNGVFTGKDGINSVDDFLNNPDVQEKAQREYKKKQWGYLKNLGADKYVGSKINDIEITPSGLLAATHLVGQGNVNKYLKSNGKNVQKDGNGISLEEYLKKFAGYDVSEFTGIPFLKTKIEKM